MRNFAPRRSDYPTVPAVHFVAWVHTQDRPGLRVTQRWRQIGIARDVSVESTAICVINDAGCVEKEFSTRSSPEKPANALGSFADALGAIGLEAGQLSNFLTASL
jgi:hypothetical protein